MSQDVVKAITVNGARVQTGRDVLPWADVVRLAGFGLGARVAVTTEAPDGLLGVQALERGMSVAVVPGLKVRVAVRG